MKQASIPALPDIFGNYALGEFHEVVPPTAISWLPGTAGWAWVAVFCLLLLAHRGIRLTKKWHANRYRREARKRLAQLSNTSSGGQFLHELNKLLKLTAIAAYSREQVAQLSGSAWTTFLNAQCANAPFTPAHSDWLAQGPYAQSTPDDETCAALTSAAVQWINSHHRSNHD